MRAWWLFLAAVLFAGATSALAAWAPAQRIDAYLDALEKHDLAHGSLAISEKGQLRYQRAIGSAVIEPGRREPADTGTRYRIGSVSKLFTAVLVMQLAEGGSVTLDGKVAEFFPDVPNALDITYRDLLAHRSGLPDYTFAPDFESWRVQPHSQADVLARIARAAPNSPPRQRHEYSSTNYLLLSYMLEKVYDRPFAQIVRTRIADKLGLARTYLGQRMSEGRHEALPYEYKPGGWIPGSQSDPDLHLGAGGMVSSPGDLVRFIDALFAGRLVSDTSLDSLRGAGGTALGLPPLEFAGRQAYGHAGRVDEYRAYVYHFPDSGISLAYAANASVLPPDELVDELVAMIFDRGRRPPTFEPVKLPAAKLDEYTGTWKSVPGAPANSPFRRFAPPGHPPQIIIRRVGDTLVHPANGRDHALVPLGNDEFIVDGMRYFLRVYPRSGEVVVRSPFWAYYFRREE
jgi:CubicO group peptidase (beta-lactamase class C family)